MDSDNLRSERVEKTQSEGRIVVLTTNDGQRIPVDMNIMSLSKTIKNMLSDLLIDGSDENLPCIELPVELPAATMNEVIEWCTHQTHHSNDADSPGAKETAEVEDKWQKAFFESKSNDEMFELIQAANYLDVEDLLEVGCKTIASMIKGKTVQELRDFFNIENDMTPEEEAEVRKENAWIEPWE